MKRLFLFVLLLLKWSLCPALPAQNALMFHRLGIREGLSNGQVNSVFEDSKGYIWLGTQSGLDRFDGFRFSNYFNKAGDERSLPNNVVDNVQEDIETNLWLHTAAGYCRFIRSESRFDSHLNQWMASKGMQGTPYYVKIDGRKNMWIAVHGHRVYYYNVRNKTAILFSLQGKGGRKLPKGTVSDMADDKDCVFMVYADGTIVKADGRQGRVLWVNNELKQRSNARHRYYSIHVDRSRNLWVTYTGHTEVWNALAHRWFETADAFLQAQGYRLPVTGIIAKTLKTDARGYLWIATDHDGLLCLNPADHSAVVYQYERERRESLPDNTIQSICLDGRGGLWLGTYKNGAAYCSPGETMFHTVPLGDVCTIAEDNSGNLWCGTNDRGIVVYDPSTGSRHWFRAAQTGLGSDIVVSSTVGKDGSLWFGSFDGGLSRYKDGHFTAYRATGRKGDLANDNVWALETDAEGNIIIGTLGGGLQVMNPQTGRFVTYNTRNSGLSSDFILSLSFDAQGNIVMAHEKEYSVLNVRTHKIIKYDKTRSGRRFAVSSINQLLVDTRGLLWNAASSGLSVYDLQTDRVEEVSLFAGVRGVAACSVVEDAAHSLWVATDKGISHVVPARENGAWSFFVTNYSDTEGLQSRQFNSRAICLCRNGNVVVGGQDGIDILPPQRGRNYAYPAKALFSGLLIFNEPLRVGDAYNGRVILNEELHDGGELTLAHSENAFTIQLASDAIKIPNKSRFLYRLKGFDDKWLLTADGMPAVTFTNLSAGSYTLEVKVVNADGTQSSEVSRLNIRIRPPFYLSTWAFLGYMLLVMLLCYYVSRVLIRRAHDRLMLEQVRREAEQARRLDRMKLDFFANVSHELRTPLSLILSPLSALIGKEQDETKKRKLQLMLRNGSRLLGLVNQVLDFRKLDEDYRRLTLVTGDVVEFVRVICQTFDELMEKPVSLTFYSSVETLMMPFDDDKLRKVMNNLLSNAYKFTPEGGRIDVALRLVSRQEAGPAQEDRLEVKVSDTGKGIADADKAHVFERFYQASGAAEDDAKGSGIGLSLVKKFVEMHGGSVSVADNPGGGSVFIFYLPVHDVPSMPRDVPDVAAQTQDTTAPPPAESPQHDLLVVDDSEEFLAFMAEELSTKFSVRVAHDGTEALERVAERRPDAILCDAVMPGMDGHALCKALKDDRNTAAIPFIMLTARASDTNGLEELRAGADDYIAKPFDMELLELRIRNLIKWHEGPQNSRIEPKIRQMDITSMDEKLVKAATDYIEDHLSDADISVETLSASLGMSRVQLYKRLTAVTGITPSEFIRNIRLRHAEQLLRKSQRSVSEIAYQVGFNNPRYFSRYFAEMYGLTPSQYKSRFGK